MKLISINRRSKIHRQQKVAARTQQSGFTIIELMIAGLLGLFLIGGVIQLFIGSNQNYRTQDDLATMQEDGRLALLFMNEQIQKGGWMEDLTKIPVPAINFNALNSFDGVTDSVSISFVDPTNNTDCTGAAVAGGVVTNRFYVEDEELMCQGNGGGVGQPLIAGVEDFQVLYGVEQKTAGTECQSGMVNSYLTAEEVVANDLMQRVLSVRIAVLLASEGNVLPQAEVKNYQVLDKMVAKNDRLARRVFQQTIFMPNAVYITAGNPEAILKCYY